MVEENQKDWDIQLPMALFAYRTALHDTTGYSPFRVTFGRSPSLPIDIILGQVGSAEEMQVPQFVEDLSCNLTNMFKEIRIKLNKAHQRNKTRYDKGVTGSSLCVGDRVWLYVPAIKQGRTKKLSSLWRGPYTIIDKVNTVNYRIQLIGSNKVLVVHYNRLKLCYGEPLRRPSRRNTQPTNSNKGTPRPVHIPSAGYTSSSNYLNNGTDRPDQSSNNITSSPSNTNDEGSPSIDPTYSSHDHIRRSQRDRHPPTRFGTYVTY